jgi:pyruvate,orthophosphate dikinase
MWRIPMPPAPRRRRRPRVDRLIHADAPAAADLRRRGARLQGLEPRAHGRARAAGAPGFVIGTGWCAEPGALARPRGGPRSQALERVSGLRLGDARRPLLLSVRSGAPVSMPGMMETLLDIGLTDDHAVRPGARQRPSAPGLGRLSAPDRRLGEVVHGPTRAFDADLEAAWRVRPGDERELDFAELRELTAGTSTPTATKPARPSRRMRTRSCARRRRAVFASWQSEQGARIPRACTAWPTTWAPR